MHDHHFPHRLCHGRNATANDQSSAGTKFNVHPEVPAILAAARKSGVKLAIASKSPKPDLYKEFLKALPDPENPSKSLFSMFQYVEIMDASKTSHFAAITKASGVQVKDMVFYDDDTRNIKEMGEKLPDLCSVLVGPGGKGNMTPLSFSIINEGLTKWRAHSKGESKSASTVVSKDGAKDGAKAPKSPTLKASSPAVRRRQAMALRYRKRSLPVQRRQPKWLQRRMMVEAELDLILRRSRLETRRMASRYYS